MKSLLVSLIKKATEQYFPVVKIILPLIFDPVR